MPVYGTVKYGEALYGAMNFSFNSYLGRYRGMRFNMLIASQGVEMFDKLIDSDNTIYNRYMVQGIILGFSETHNFIQMTIPYFDDLQVADESFLTWYGDDNGVDSLQLRGADYLDGRRIRWGLGAIPFDTSLLHVLGAEANWTNEDGTAVVWAALGSTVYSTVAQVTTVINGFPAGAYRVYYLLAGTTGTEIGNIDCTGALSNGYSDVTPPTEGQWYSYDFRADENDSITFRFERTAIGVNINCGEIVIWPITNSKNFPLDNQNRALQLITQKLRGAGK